ncbi:hypothetical protein BDV29DRAFT_163214 [Aspergillus leporis]|uniref:Uncharacterized protein n=1 Tax=Aspergillus leporis TaxID=41062 RepID=A0A5N5WKJ4_9EURO|nr:hypothetical protein BDV29DRAFT_163214 [Aspergillus leporis]
MAPSRVEWPSLTANSATRGNEPCSLNERVLNLHHDKSALLGYIMAHNHGIPKPIVEQAVADLRRTTLDIWKNTYATQIALTTESTRPLASCIQSYAQAAALAPPPGHVQSAHGLGGSPAATLFKLNKDREAIIKLEDPDAVKTFRRLKSSVIKHRAEKAHLAPFDFLGPRAQAERMCWGMRSPPAGSSRRRYGPGAGLDIHRTASHHHSTSAGGGSIPDEHPPPIPLDGARKSGDNPAARFPSTYFHYWHSIYILVFWGIYKIVMREFVCFITKGTRLARLCWLPVLAYRFID